jgi:hypothetical protein
MRWNESQIPTNRLAGKGAGLPHHLRGRQGLKFSIPKIDRLPTVWIGRFSPTQGLSAANELRAVFAFPFAPDKR